jgi:hypothetical protein
LAKRQEIASSTQKSSTTPLTTAQPIKAVSPTPVIEQVVVEPVRPNEGLNIRDVNNQSDEVSIKIR